MAAFIKKSSYVPSSAVAVASEMGAGFPEMVSSGGAFGVAAPDRGSTGTASPPIGSPDEVGVEETVDEPGEGGTDAGSEVGVSMVPIGATESLSGERDFSGSVGLEYTESWGGPPKASPSSRKFRAEIGTIFFVPSG